MQKYFRSLCLVIAVAFMLPACKQMDVYEQNGIIKNGLWKAADSLTGSVAVLDTNALYNISIIIRHTDAYRYNNIWLNIATQAPGEEWVAKQLSVPLANDATGWFGIGMNDIWEARTILEPNIHFRHAGKFNFSIKQIMRDEPLPHILNAGLRVEKAPNQ